MFIGAMLMLTSFIYAWLVRQQTTTYQLGWFHLLWFQLGRMHLFIRVIDPGWLNMSLSTLREMIRVCVDLYGRHDKLGWFWERALLLVRTVLGWADDYGLYM